MVLGAPPPFLGALAALQDRARWEEARDRTFALWTDDHRNADASAYVREHMVTGGFTWDTIEREISKCVVRCVSCHRRKTAREQGIYAYKAGFRPLAEAEHPYA